MENNNFPATDTVQTELNKDASPSAPQKTGLVATSYNSGFSLSHDTYNGICAASNGIIYYVLCSESVEEGGKMYSFNPGTKQITLCGDLTEVCGEKGLKTVPQGKSHVNFIESNGKLFLSTHVGYYNVVQGMDKMGVPPQGYQPYPGGHLLSYDLESGKFDDLAIAPHGEGVLTMNMDVQREIIYGITWPSGYFFCYDILRKEMKDIGPVSRMGEKGTGPEYRTLCRSIAINPNDGAVYFTTSEGDILVYSDDQKKIELINGDDLKKDYFGVYEPDSPGHMGYNWRQVVWHPKDECFYGVHGNSGYLFRFNPRVPLIEVLERITSKSSQRSGMFDQFSYGYLGFTLAPDNRTLYYLTGGPIYVNTKRLIGKSSTAKGEAKGLENLHLITYDIPTGKYTDHGAVFYPDGQRPLYVNSIAIDGDGTIYSLARINENGIIRTDLISISNPISNMPH